MVVPQTDPPQVSPVSTLFVTGRFIPEDMPEKLVGTTKVAVRVRIVAPRLGIFDFLVKKQQQARARAHTGTLVVQS